MPEPIDVAYPCQDCDHLLDPGPIPEKEGTIEIVCECGSKNHFTSGIRDPLRFRWYPVYRCMVSFCKNEKFWMTPLCPEHWTGIPTMNCQMYWKSSGSQRVKIANDLARGVESGVWGHREPVNISVSFKF